MDIFKLVGSVFVDTEAANESLKKTDEKAEKTGGTLGKIAGTAAKVGTAVVAGASAAVGGIMSLANSTAATADEIDKASIRMGISAEAFQEYRYAAEQCGVQTTVLEKAAKKLEGTDINFDQAMESIMSLGTAEERAQKASELFGDAVAYNLSPLIEQSGEDFDGLIQRANDLGLVMSGDDVAAGVVLGDTMSDVTKSFEMLGTKLGSAVVPLVQKFADFIIEHMPEIQNMIDQITPIITELFDTIVPPLMDLAEQLLPVIMNLISTLLPPITQIVSAILPIFVQLIQLIAPFLTQIAEMVLPIIVDLVEKLTPVLQPLLELLSPILELLSLILQPLLDLINLILPPIIELVTKVTGKVTSLISDCLTKVVDFFKNFKENIGKVWNDIKEVFKKPINAIIGFINGLVSGVVSGINGMIRALNKIHIDIPDWVPLLGGKSFGFSIGELTAPQIPLLAKGGEFSGSAIVGEDGPELISTGRSTTRVTPLNDNNNAFADFGDKLDRIIQLLGRMDGMGLYVDGTKLVGAISKDMNTQFGKMNAQIQRGVFA